MIENYFIETTKFKFFVTCIACREPSIYAPCSYVALLTIGMSLGTEQEELRNVWEGGRKQAALTRVVHNHNHFDRH